MVDPLGVATVDLRQSTIFSRLRGLLEVTRLVRTNEGLPELLAAIAQTVSDSLAFRSVVINLYRREWDDFVVTTVHGGNEARETLLGQVLQPDEWAPLLDQRFLQRGAYLVPNGEFDWSAHAAYTPDIPPSDDPSAWHPEDALFVPMRTSDGQLLGVLSVDEPVSGRRPTGDEIDVLVAVAEHAALAVQAAQEAARARANSEALARLLEVSARLNDTADADELLQLVCSATSEALGFEKVAVQLRQEDTAEFDTVAEVGFAPGENEGSALRLEQLETLLQPEFDVEGCFLIPSEQARALLPTRTSGYCSKLNGRGLYAWQNHWLFVPLRDREGTLLGYIWADDPLDRLSPEPERLRILRAFANQTTTALEQAAQVAAIRASSEYHRALIDSSPMAIVDFDLEGRVRSWNAAATLMFGWNAGETIGRFSPIVPPDETQPFLDNLAEIGGGTTLRDLDLSRLRADGTLIDISITAGPVRNERGEITGVVSMMMDLSERKLSERAIANSEARKDAILRAAPESVVIVDGQGSIVEVNPAAEETFGWMRSDVAGQSFLELSVAAEHRSELARALELGSGPLLGARHEIVAIRSDGRSAAAELRINRIEVPGEVLYAISLDDVTKRREREQRLRDAEAKYRTLVEQLPLATYINEIGLPTRTSYMSPRIESMLGYPVSDWLAPDWFTSIIHPDDVERVAAGIERTHINGEHFKQEYRLRTADGRWVWVLDETTAVRDAEYRPLFLQGFMIDVTARRDGDEALRRSEELYRLVVETSHDLIVVVDLEGIARYVSPSLTEVLGYEPNEIVGTRYGLLIDPNDLPTVHRYFHDRVAGLDGAPPPTRIRRKDGAWVTVEGAISILRDEAGEASGYLTVSRVVHRATLRAAAS
jgi:PAS domain S-box-containing protein